MEDERPERAHGPPIDVHDPLLDDGPVQSVQRLIAQAREAADSEIAYWRAVAAFGTVALRRASIAAVLAILLLFVGLLTVAIGSVLAIGHQLGFWAATAIVAGLFLIGGLVAAILSRRAVRQFTDAAKAQD